MKHLSKICVLLVVFVLVSFAPSAFAEGPPESQKIGVGFATTHSGGNLIGLSFRSWTESPWGFEVGWTTRGYKIPGNETYRWHVIPVSVLYTLTHYDVDSVYIRPYVGGGINFGTFPTWECSVNNNYTSYGCERKNATKIGGQGFGGAEFTFKGFPKLGLSADLGFSGIGGGNNFGFNFKAHYYLK